MRLLLLRFFLVCVGLDPLLATAAHSVTRVIYSAGEVAGERRYDDMIETLCTALEKTRAQFGPYECRSDGLIQPKKRVV